MKRKALLVISAVMTATMIFTSCGQKQKVIDNPGKSDTAKVDKKVQETKKAPNPEKLPQTSKDRKDTLIVGITAPSGKFNPIYSDSVYDSYVTSLVFDGLMTNDKEGNPIGLLAEKWDISQDNKTYTFHLKKGVKFSDGTELKASDVAFTYTALCDPKYDGPRVDAVEKLEGFKEYNKGDAKEVSGIKVIDDYTISFTLTDVKAPAIIGDFGYGIMSKNYYGFEKGSIQKLKDLFLKPIGTGAYKFKAYEAGQTVEFVKNDSYFRGTPKIANIIMKVTNSQTNIQELKSGGTDMDVIAAKPENINMLNEAGFLDLQFYPDNGYSYIGLNLRNDMFKDKKVRQALTYGLNRKGFVDSYYKGYADVCNAPMSPVSWAYTEDIEKYDYNADKANKLLDEAGWVKKDDGWRYKDGKKFTIHWLTYTGSKYVDNLVPIVKENWKAIGVEVIPELMEFATLSEKVYDKQEFEMYNMAWSLSIDPDPSGIFAISQDTLGGFNSVGWRNDEAEKLVQEGLKTTDLEKRKEIYKKWTKMANDDLPYIFISQNKDMWAVSSKVKGIEISPYRDWTYDVWKAEIAAN